MNRSLALVSLDWIRTKDPRTSLAHASLLARLAQVPGLEVRSLTYAVNEPSFKKEKVLEDLKAADTDDIAIGAYVWNERVVQWLLPALRARGFRGRIDLGGPQVSYAAAGVDRYYPQADAFVRGFGEEPLAALMTTHGPIPGVSYAGQDHRAEPSLSSLSSLPSPYLSGILPYTHFLRWETQRGCRYRCSFCQHRAPDGRAPVQQVADARIAAEIDGIAGAGVPDVAVLDPIFHNNPSACGILRRFREQNFAGRLSLQSRFEQVDENFLDACSGLNIRLEFGLQTIHHTEMRAVQRINNLAICEKVIRQLQERRIPFEISLIYGLPGQTLASFEASLRWCQDRGVATVHAFPLMLLRGTGLEQERERWGLAENDDDIPLVVRSNSFSRSDWEEMRRMAETPMTPMTPMRPMAA